MLWKQQQSQLVDVYESDMGEVLRLIDYISDKLTTTAEQQENRVLLDTNLINYEINRLRSLSEDRRSELLKAMPKKPVVLKRNKPKVMYKSDGELSLNGKRWIEFLIDNNLPENTEGEVEYVSGYEEPNPDSIPQIKDWLFSLGWEPEHFKYVRDKSTNEFRRIPQITNEFESTELCPSVIKLTDKVPELSALAGYSTIKHRLAMYEGFLRDMDSSGRLQWDIGGFTNTFRLKHRKVVNLPSSRAPYAENIRGVFIADEGGYLAGADLSNIEDLSKRHYIKPLDPEYVETMMSEDYDGHLEIAVRAGLLTQEQSDDHKSGKADYSEERQKAKVVNFCMPVDSTEVLTPEGWKTYDELSVGDSIITYRDGGLEVKEITELPYFQNVEVGVLGNNRWGFECTENHRWVVNRCKYKLGRRDGYVESIVETVDLKYEDLIVNSAPYKNESKFKIEDCRVLGWILADGHLEFSKKPKYRTNKYGKKMGVVCSISQKKYVDELRADLKDSGVIYVEDLPREDGVVVFRIMADSVRELLGRLELPNKGKHEIDFTEFIFNSGYSGRKGFLERFIMADGGNKIGRNGKNLNTLMVYQNKGNISEAIKLCATLQGFKYSCHGKETYTGNVLETIALSSSTHTTMQKVKFNKSRIVDVFCCNNENETFIVKQNGLVTITGNSSTYGIGAKTLARNMKTSEREAKRILDAYWERNWAVKKFAESCKVKTINGQMWVKQPVSGFWYTLRSSKDIFSTVNQGTAVYIFDCWLKELRILGNKVSGQMHDELIIKELWNIRSPEEVKDTFAEAMRIVNEKLKLNLEVSFDIDFGRTYLDIH